MKKHHSIIKQKVYGAKQGYCRICGEFAKLTSDHVPPRCMGNSQKVQIQNGAYGSNTFVVSKNGAKFRTICQKCNNDLGHRYDPYLKTLYDMCSDLKYGKGLQKARLFAGKRKININPYLLIKAICGHLLALDFRHNCDEEKSIEEVLSMPPSNTGFFHELRNFYLGNTNCIEETEIFCWFYPFDTTYVNFFQVIFPNLINFSSVNFICHYIKTFPLGILISPNLKNTVNTPVDVSNSETGEKGKLSFNINKRLINLPYKNENISLTLDVFNLFSEDFLQNPGGNGAILGDFDSGYKFAKLK